MSDGPGERSDGSGARPTTVRIGLTGPIGCGKSTVALWLAEAGAAVVDADAIARIVSAPGTAAHDAILERFGDGVRAADGTLDRAALAAVVFADPAGLRELESIVHPAVRPALLERVAAAERAGAPAVAIEAIKLVESGLAELCDEVWLVTCDPEEQRRRLTGRGATEADADRRMAAQAGILDRIAPVATRRIDTSGEREEARRRVMAAFVGATGAARRR